METATRFLRRDPADVKPWAETCGQIRPLIEEKDGAAGEVHQVEIQAARLHYHERTDEFYHVIAGRGTMTLDGEVVELHPGVVVYVPRGVRHKAAGDLTVLVVCVPPGVHTVRLTPSPDRPCTAMGSADNTNWMPSSPNMRCIVSMTSGSSRLMICGPVSITVTRLPNRR